MSTCLIIAKAHNSFSKAFASFRSSVSNPSVMGDTNAFPINGGSVSFRDRSAQFDLDRPNEVNPTLIYRLYAMVTAGPPAQRRAAKFGAPVFHSSDRRRG
jgi:hypothetical protein